MLCAVVLLVGAGEGRGWAQRASTWRVYRAADGLTESLTTAITISPRGALWVKHGEVDAVSQLDGYTVRHIPGPGERSFRVYESRAGRIWSVYTEGLLEFDDGRWLPHRTPAVAWGGEVVDPQRAMRPLALVPAEEDRVLLLFAEGLADYRALRRELRILRRATDSRIGPFADLLMANDGGLWIAARDGLAKVPGPLRRLDPQTVWSEFPLPAGLGAESLRRPFEDDEGGVTTIGEVPELRRRVLVHFDGQHYLTRGIPGESLRFAWRGLEPDQFWGLTLNALVKLYGDRTEVVREEPVVGQFFDVAVQPRGVFWLATLEGLLRYTPPAWRTPQGAERYTSVVHAARVDGQGVLWFVTSGGLVWLAQGQWQSRDWPEGFDPVFRARDGVFGLPGGRVAICASEQLWVFDPSSNQFTAVLHPEGKRVRKILRADETGAYWVQTARAGAGDEEYAFERFDGSAFHTSDAAPPPVEVGSDLFFFERAANGDLWVGGSQGPALWREGRWQRFGSADGYGSEGALNWFEFPDGRIWCAGLSQIAEFDGKVWQRVLAGLDRVSAMLPASDGSIWVATGNGLYRYFKETWSWVGEEDGLRGSGCYAVLEDSVRRIWVGTSRGVSLYHPRADIDPPKTLSVSIEQTGFGGTERSVEVTIRGRDRWQMTADDRLFYQHRLDGSPWSPVLRESSLVFRNLAPGRHQVEVRTLDRNWNFEVKPLAMDFEVAVAWYQDRRVLGVGFAGLLVALFFAALAVNRHLQLRRSYAAVEQKVAERTRELQQATEALVQSQKMTALGTLASGIAHDFNNILSIIKGSAQIIQTNVTDHEKVLVRVSRIRTAVDQASGIVKAMLGFGRTADRVVRPNSVTDVVEDTIRLLGDRFLREVTVRRELEDNLPEVLGVRDLMQQMLLNLILNAADALGPGGEIVVRAEGRASLPATVILAPGRPGPLVALSVRDTGCGIAPDLLPRIFEPFFSTKAFSSRRGTGLGLYMVYEFARETGLGLAVESEVGKGSCFTVLLPVATSEPTAA